MQSSHCRPVIQIFPAEGGGSKVYLREASGRQDCRPRVTIGANTPFGKAAFGNIPFAMMPISNVAPTTFISTRSSIDWCRRRRRGHFPRCIDMFGPACLPGIGAAAVAQATTPISGNARIDPDCAALHPGYRSVRYAFDRCPNSDIENLESNHRRVSKSHRVITRS